jgi:hypothetical protein
MFFLCRERKITGVHTFLSHGVREYSVDLLSKMRSQLHISGNELDNLITCPLSADDYATLLEKRGIF